jgi:hypothetical protein
MKMQIKVEKGEVRIGIEEMMGSLTAEEQKAFIKTFSISDAIIEHVVDFICDEDKDGWWAGNSPNTRQRILSRIEQKQLELCPTYCWEPWDKIREALKAIRAKEHIYWFIYHKLPERLREVVINAMTEAGVESDYTTKDADADIARIEEMIKTAFTDMKRGNMPRGEK